MFDLIHDPLVAVLALTGALAGLFAVLGILASLIDGRAAVRLHDDTRRTQGAREGMLMGVALLLALVGVLAVCGVLGAAYARAFDA